MSYKVRMTVFVVLCHRKESMLFACESTNDQNSLVVDETKNDYNSI